MRKEKRMQKQKDMERKQLLEKTSVVGIVTNLVLAAFKILVGLIGNSSLILTDGINSISEAAESIIILIGVKLTGKEADRNHPLGYGRVEYMMDSIVSVLILYAGVTSFVKGLKLIQHPEESEVTIMTYVVLIVAMLVKYVIGRHEKHVSEETKSNAMRAASINSLASVVVSLSVLLTLLLELELHINLEAFVTIIISVVILHTGYESLKQTVQATLGMRIDGETARKIKHTICEFDGVYGAYDLIVHAYGVDRMIGSVHIEVNSSMTMIELDRLERKIVQTVKEQHNVLLAGISIYASVIDDPESNEMKLSIEHVLQQHEGIMQMHGFLVDFNEMIIKFDIVVSFDVKDRLQLATMIDQEVSALYPDYEIDITVDLDVDL